MRALSRGIGLAPQFDAPLTRRFDERGPAVIVAADGTPVVAVGRLPALRYQLACPTAMMPIAA
jgi:hypothetical protein